MKVMAEKVIYETYFKKGHTMQHIRFLHEGDLDSAVQKIRPWLQRRHLKHIHTIPFLSNLDEINYNGDDDHLEEIDIDQEDPKDQKK